MNSMATLFAVRAGKKKEALATAEFLKNLHQASALDR